MRCVSLAYSAALHESASGTLAPFGSPKEPRPVTVLHSPSRPDSGRAAEAGRDPTATRIARRKTITAGASAAR
jgi:hypothetical protein